MSLPQRAVERMLRRSGALAPGERILEAHVGTIVSMQLGPRPVPLGTDALSRGHPLPRLAASILCYRPSGCCSSVYDLELREDDAAAAQAS